jgi:AraC family transcriptional regulator
MRVNGPNRAESFVAIEASNSWGVTQTMRVAVDELVPLPEPQMSVRHEQMLGMFLRPGSIELGFRRSEMARLAYDAGEMLLCHRHAERWVRADDKPHILSLAISDEALSAACDEVRADIELRGVTQLVDPRVGALVAAVNAERIAGFPSGQLFLDSVEQALAVALVGDYAIRPRSLRKYRGGLGPARLRTIKELVHAKLEDELTLIEMAKTLDLTPAHFARMFRKSTGETPHGFVLRQRIERAKTMLRQAQTRVLDVAVACGFKTQQHFARVFRQLCGTSPTEYRRQFLAIPAMDRPFSDGRVHLRRH